MAPSVPPGASSTYCRASPPRRPRWSRAPDDLRLWVDNGALASGSATLSSSRRLPPPAHRLRTRSCSRCGNDYEWATGAVAFGGGDTVAVLNNRTEQSLGAVRVDAGGTVTTPVFKLMSVPSGLAGHGGEQRLAHVGADIVALWYTNSVMRLARATP